MKRTFIIFKALTLASLKSPSSIFWMMIFPVVLLLILASIFSNIQKSITVRVAVVNESSTFKNTNLDFSSYMIKALMNISHPYNGKKPVLSLKLGNNERDFESFLSDLKTEKLDAVVLIPKNFNAHVFSRLSNLPLNFYPQVKIYTRSNSQSSDIAFSILSSVISSLNKVFWKRGGKKFLSTRIEYVGKGGNTFSYIDFLTAGIIVMAFMTVSLFGVTDDLLVQREKKVLKRFFVSPITKSQYIVGMSLSNISLEIVQLLLLLVAGKMLGANLRIDIFSISFALYALIVSMPLGFFVASISKSANSGNALANVFNFLFMFLGGLFFPISNVPYFIKVIAYSIPTTYLANGLRSSMGVSYSATSTYLNVLVPLIWAIFMSVYAIRHFKWEVG